MIIGVAGHAGVGKTTALQILERLDFGKRIYAGDCLKKEIMSRGLSENPKNEKLVRTELRAKFGKDAFARLASTDVDMEAKAKGALVDAIYCVEELDYFHRELSHEVCLIAISASFLNRTTRLAKREERPFTKYELEDRDKFEITDLGINAVIARANHQINNDGSLSELERHLSIFFGL